MEGFVGAAGFSRPPGGCCSRWSRLDSENNGVWNFVLVREDVFSSISLSSPPSHSTSY